MEEIEWLVLKLSNFSTTAQFSWREGKLNLHDIPRFSIYLKYMNFAYKVLIHLRKWDICPVSPTSLSMERTNH